MRPLFFCAVVLLHLSTTLLIMQSALAAHAAQALAVTTDDLAQSQAQHQLQKQLPNQTQKSAELDLLESKVQTQALNFEGIQRDYLIYIPSNAQTTTKQPRPVLMALHGGGSNPESMLKRWLPLAQQHGFILVLPRGLGTSRMNAAWNAGGCCGIPMWNNVNDIGFIRAVLRQVQAQQQVDAKRIYLTGFSNGGMLSYELAAQADSPFAAVAVVSGNVFDLNMPVAKALPMLIIHGLQDQVVPFQGGISPYRFVNKAQSQPFSPVPQVADFWARANGCQSQINQALPDITLTQFTGCKAPVLFYQLHSASHVWADGHAPYLPFQQYAHYGYLNASALIWNFFQQHLAQ